MFKQLGDLKKVLTKPNIMYLDIIVTILTERSEDPEVYDKFWSKFKKFFPQAGSDKAAWAALNQLHKIIRSQLNK